MRILLRAMALLVVLSLLGVSAADAQAPTITRGTTSNSGAIGASITITGTGFDATPANNVVKFGGGIRGTVTGGSTTSLTVTVPLGASYGRITVTTPAGLTAYSPDFFDVTFANTSAIDTTFFASPVSYAGTGTWPSMMAVGDLDGDGKPDLIVANNEPGSSGISVFRNTSTKGVVDASSFAAAANFATTVNGRPWGVDVGDFDGDGKLDIAVANGSTNNVSIFRNISSGAGTISFATRIDSTAGAGPHDLMVADIDLDGKPDILLTEYNSGGAGTLTVLRNTSTGTGVVSFAAHQEIAVGNGPRGLAVGDIDVDGKPDVVVANYTDGTLSLLQNTSTPGTVSMTSKGTLTSILTPVSVTIDDFDNDGLPDVIGAGYGDGIWIYRAEGDFTSWESPAILHKAPGQGSIIGADVDGDGKADLVAGNALEASYNRGTITVMKNLQPGSGSFTTASFGDSVNFTLPSLPYQAVVADVDLDGRPDLIGANIYKANISVLRNRSGDTLTITSTASANGTITPAGVTKVLHGASQSYTITPAGGAHTDSVVVDGINRHVLASYSFDSVYTNHTIAAYFSAGTAFAITSTAGTGGTISPLGVVNVISGASQAYTFTPNSGFAIDSVIVDGVKVATAASYTFTNVTATHTIRVSFAATCKISPVFFLQGPAASNVMSTGLKSGGVLAAKFAGSAIPGLAVDSVTIELRNAQTAAGSTIQKFAGAWLKSNGSIVMFSDTTKAYVEFDVAPGSYYIVVRHRNHVAVMTAAAVALTGTSSAYDFTTDQAKAFGTNPLVLVGTKYCLYAGDADQSGTVDAADRSASWNQRNLTGYYGEDCDLSGTVDAADRSITWNSRNVSNQVP
jgi:hypothetical protein